SGIAQVAAKAGHAVTVYDNNSQSLQKARENIAGTYAKLIEKQKLSNEEAHKILSRISFTENAAHLNTCNLIIEAIVEDLEIKKKVFALLEKTTEGKCILASNTSSLSITSIAASCVNPKN